MGISDLRDLDHNLNIDADLCIIGSGAAGLSIAKEFANTSLQVWVLESGGFKEEEETQALYEIENVGAPRMPQPRVRNRILGGSTHTWFGRCAPFNQMDFKERDWVPHSGWPIDLEDVAPYLDRAGKNLGLGPSYFDQRLAVALKVADSHPKFSPKLVQNQFWQYSKVSNTQREPVRFGKSFLQQLKDVDNVNILIHANVTHINTNAEGNRVESVEVSTLEQKQARIRSKVVILACGGVENARLLLASNQILPKGVGNQNDMVGRFLADHPGTKVGKFNAKDARRVQNYFGNYWLFDRDGKHYYNRGLALSPTVQEKEGLLNCAAYLNPTVAPDDPWEAIKRIKRRFKAEKPAAPLYQDCLSIIRHPRTLAHGLYRYKVVKRPPINCVQELELYCLTEQLPDPESRITLSGKKDALGMPLSRLDWHISTKEKESVLRLGQLIQQESKRLGLPALELSSWLESDEPWVHRFKDRSHPSCTTRMSDNPKTGVVDTNCQVHGIHGLFVTGSSTFPTSGYANPTFMIIALSMRLADWIKTNHFANLQKSVENSSAQFTTSIQSN